MKKEIEMQTVTLDILNDKAFRLLQDLELLQLIRLRKDKTTTNTSTDWGAKHKGAMSKQSIADIDAQLKELRDGWE